MAGTREIPIRYERTTITKSQQSKQSTNANLSRLRYRLEITTQVKMAYSLDSERRNRSTFVKGRDQIREFLSDKWVREQEYRLIKEIWAHSDTRIAVRFCYEYRKDDGKWFRAYGESLIF
jgi:nuclear transport factor 2 (NTF2) superfamily protein